MTDNNVARIIKRDYMSNRNQEILRLRQEGKTYKQIGEQFSISPQAVMAIVINGKGKTKIRPTVLEIYEKVGPEKTLTQISSLVKRYKKDISPVFSMEEIVAYIGRRKKTMNSICSSCGEALGGSLNRKYCLSCSTERKKYRAWSEERREKFKKYQREYYSKHKRYRANPSLKGWDVREPL